jgi:hypothetical protein
MATVDDVRRIALGLPETSERESRGAWTGGSGTRVFVWERPLRKGDIAWLTRAPAKLAKAFLAL